MREKKRFGNYHKDVPIPVAPDREEFAGLLPPGAKNRFFSLPFSSVDNA